MSTDAREAVTAAVGAVVLIACGALCCRIVSREHHPCCDSLPRSEIKCRCEFCSCCENCRGQCR